MPTLSTLLNELACFKPSNAQLLVALISSLFGLRQIIAKPARPRKIPHHAERVLVLGATGGIGRAIAQEYASRGANICVVGRRQTQLDDVVRELGGADRHVMGVRGDFANVDDMVRVRAAIEEAWDGLDTLAVVAGVSALQPLMVLAGVENPTSSASAVGIQHMVDVAAAATAGNYTGPMVAAGTFIPMLSQTSPSPSILLLSSLAAVVPAPTRTLYGSTKGAALLLYQSLAIEHPGIKFSFILPWTVEGDFRAGAVDGGPVREKNPTSIGLKRGTVAKACLKAVDWGTRTVFMPWFYRYANIVYWLWPSYVEWRARIKYNYSNAR
ncbi:NAD(P)-binding protein [Athelia psychrophila]|uniref:NAD(P)-binding protein n=1 Tax=Athelia psychrophila TaxID=1759441 RepID=A0A166KN13_9AGAM|nr:NAD(P)-binding protein [Fibularhizoctonia sp. CBS 109695]